MEINWAIAAVAFGVGALVGLTGVGAGAIMTPVLVLIFGISLPVAIATDLIFATVTKLIAVPIHNRLGSIDWHLAKRMWSGSVPGTLVGVAIVVLATTRQSTDWLVWPLAIVVLITSLTFGYRAIMPGNPRLSHQIRHRQRLPSPVVAAGGFGIGGAVALTSVGAGVLGMALLVRLAPPTVEPRELVGTDLVHAIPIALIAGLAYGGNGLVSWSLLGTLLIGSIPGVALGAGLLGKVSGRKLYAGLSLILFATVLLIARSVII